MQGFTLKRCVRGELHLRTRENENSYKLKAKFALSVQQRRSFCEWLCGVSLPDGLFKFQKQGGPFHDEIAEHEEP